MLGNLREIAFQLMFGLFTPIGGKGLTVEIDESYFGKSIIFSIDLYIIYRLYIISIKLCLAINQ